jgi:hypothetical protein
MKKGGGILKPPIIRAAVPGTRVQLLVASTRPEAWACPATFEEWLKTGDIPGPLRSWPPTRTALTAQAAQLPRRVT